MLSCAHSCGNLTSLSPVDIVHDFTIASILRIHPHMKLYVLMKCRFLTEDEIAPVMDKLRPGELYYAKQQSDYLLHEVDIYSMIKILMLVATSYVFACLVLCLSCYIQKLLSST